MHVLMTSDTVGGVWTYTQELVSGLVRQGTRVTLVSFGGIPGPGEMAWTQNLPNLDYRPTSYRLEWMQDSEPDVKESSRYLEAVIRAVTPDILHLNQYCYGRLSCPIPRIVVAHSDVVSWWVAVHGEEPPESSWIKWYRETVTKGLRSADLVIAPTQWMLDAVQKYYAPPSSGLVIHNGRDPSRFNANREKEQFILSVGRQWDAGKQTRLVMECDHPIPICIVGSEHEPGKPQPECQQRDRADSTLDVGGVLSPRQLGELYARAAIYVATSRYEPFGLAPLEAALSRCALILNDIPVFHELWEDSAVYFQNNNRDDLARVLQLLSADAGSRRRYANRAYERAQDRFRAIRMVKQYADVYARVAALEQVA
jgi:glycogen(starch) synthase